jgi:proteic killer suppression protein
VKGMIISFGDKETEKIWQGIVSKKLPREIQEIARRKLRMINNSVDVIDLRIPPANRLEKLKGNLSDYYSIRINNQWRITFIWENNNAFEVKIVDYH